MNPLIEVLGEILRRMLDFLPKAQIIDSCEGGVAFKKGLPLLVSPGQLYWYWPFWTRLDIIPVNRQTIKMEVQNFTTKDGETISFRVAVAYSIHDPMKAVLVPHDMDKSLEDLAAGAIIERLKEMTLEQMRGELGENEELRKGIQATLHSWGLSIEKAMLTDLAISRVHRIMGIERIQSNANAS